MNTAEQISYNRIALIGAIGTLLLFPMTMIIGWQQSPPAGSPDQEFAQYFAANQANVVTMALIVASHSLTRLTFAGGLCGVLRQAERGGATLTGLALAFVAVEVALEIAAFTLLATGGRLAETGADPGILAAIGSSAQDLMLIHGVPLALFALLASVVMLRTRVLPVWLGWLGLAAGGLLTVTSLNFVLRADVLNALTSVGVFLLFTPWMVACGVILFRRARGQTLRPAPPVEPPPA